MDWDLNKSILGMGVWQDAHTGYSPITRIDTKGMSEQQVSGYMDELKAAGFKPELRESSKLGGQSIRLTGGDALRIIEMRRETITAENWQDGVAGGLISRVATRGMEQDRMVALVNALKGEKIDPQVHMSEKLGPTLRVKGLEVLRIHHFQEQFGEGKAPVAQKAADNFAKRISAGFNKFAARIIKIPEAFLHNNKPDAKNFARVMSVADPKQKPPGQR